MGYKVAVVGATGTVGRGLLQIMAEANKENFEFDKLEKLILQDVSISYKLLRFINSAYFRRIQKISSIKQAIVLL